MYEEFSNKLEVIFKQTSAYLITQKRK